jgi:hypothetical protein
MKIILIVIILMTVAMPATADAIRITSKEEFLEAIKRLFSLKISTNMHMAAKSQ